MCQHKYTWCKICSYLTCSVCGNEKLYITTYDYPYKQLCYRCYQYL